jgi:hypothetical protein
MNQPPSHPVPGIRRATPDDAATLGKIAAETFVETFGHLYPPEDLQAYLTKTYAVDRCCKILVDPAVGVWFAMVDDAPAGFIVVGRCKLPVANLETCSPRAAARASMRAGRVGSAAASLRCWAVVRERSVKTYPSRGTAAPRLGPRRLNEDGHGRNARSIEKIRPSRGGGGGVYSPARPQTERASQPA